MRSLILAAALAVTSLTAPPTAEACGGDYANPPAPVLYLVYSDSAGAHTFVLLNQPVDEEPHTWRRVAPKSHNLTRVAEAPALSAPVDLTLVGPAGTKVVSTRTKMLVEPARGIDRTPSVALRVPRGNYAVAAFGAHADYAWEPLVPVGAGPELDTWSRQVQLPPEELSLTRAGATTMLTYHDPKTNAYRTEIKHHGWTFGGGTGRALGVLTANGDRYAVIAYGKALTVVRVARATSL